MVCKDGKDVTIIACGVLVSKSMEAAKLLEQEGISVRVVDMYSVKPIDKQLIIDCCKQTGAIVTAEEHNIIGGLGFGCSRSNGAKRMQRTGGNGWP